MSTKGGQTLLATSVGSDDWAFVVPDAAAELKSYAVRLAHDDPMAAHGGIARTSGRLASAHVTWRSVDADVRAFVRSQARS